MLAEVSLSVLSAGVSCSAEAAVYADIVELPLVLFIQPLADAGDELDFCVCNLFAIKFQPPMLTTQVKDRRKGLGCNFP